MVEAMLIDLKALLVERDECNAGTVQKIREALAQGKTQYRTLRDVTEILKKKAETAAPAQAKTWHLKLGIASFFLGHLGDAVEHLKQAESALAAFYLGKALADRQEFDEALKVAMLDETHLFFNELLKNDLSVSNVISSDFTFANGRLATHYGIPDVYGSRFRRVTLSNHDQRGGLLAHGALLATTSYPDRTSPVLRGKWLLNNIFGLPVPPPPPAIVPAPVAASPMPPASTGDLKSFWERFHRACANEDQNASRNARGGQRPSRPLM